jgi:hypothetical protein
MALASLGLSRLIPPDPEEGNEVVPFGARRPVPAQAAE